MSEVAEQLEKAKPMTRLTKAAREYGIPITSFRRYGQRGRFPVYSIDGAEYVVIAEVNKWIESSRKVPA